MYLFPVSVCVLYAHYDLYARYYDAVSGGPIMRARLRAFVKYTYINSEYRLSVFM